jgi:hypothetical protein
MYIVPSPCANVENNETHFYPSTPVHRSVEGTIFSPHNPISDELLQCCGLLIRNTKVSEVIADVT